MAAPSRQKANAVEVRRRRRQLTDEERIRIALDRFTPLQYGRRMEEISKLSANYDRDPAVVSRAIAEAFKRRLVEIRRLPANDRPNQSPRDLSLEHRLQSELDLSGAVVIRFEPPPQKNQDPAKYKEEYNRWNDRLHSALGLAMAQVIATGTVFRSGDRIGIGSGRGVYFTVDWLARINSNSLRAKEVEVFSLTGATHPQTHADEGTNLRLDADTNVNLFSGKCFAAPVKPYFVHSPMAASREASEAVYTRARWLGRESSKPTGGGREKIELQPLTQALVGVGAFTLGHRLYEEGKARLRENPKLGDEALKQLYGESKAGLKTRQRTETTEANGTAVEDHIQSESILDVIGDDLAKLACWCDQCTSPSTSPVADICHNLLFVEPPSEAATSEHLDTLKRLVKDCIKAINQRGALITVSETRLKETETIMLVAGGPKKIGSIRLLFDQKYPIRFLCTDDITAQGLLRQA